MGSQRSGKIVAIVVVVWIAATCLVGDLEAQEYPELIGRWPYGPTSAIEAVGPIVYFGDGAVLRIFDLGEPSSPEFLGEVVLAGAIQDIEVTGSTVFVATEAGGLEIVDAVDPSAPVRIGGLRTEGRARDVAIEGPVAYVAGHDGGLRIVDVHDPTHPLEIGSLVYVTATDRGLLVYDVRDPSNPYLLGDSLPVGVSARGVAFSRGLAFAAVGDSGLEVFRGRWIFIDGFESGDTSAWPPEGAP